MDRVLVLGGNGFLGSRVVTGLQRAGVDVSVAGRRGPVVVDVSRPETFSAIEPFALVIDLCDTVSSPTDAVIRWCLERGKTVIEATSEAACVERLHAASQGLPGRLVLGGGIFTGVSNLLARDVAKQDPLPAALTLGVASSPFSGSGRGTIELMLRAMVVPAIRYEAGRRIEEPTIRSGPTLDFAGTRRSTGYMSLAEPFMVASSTRVPTVEVLFAPKPGFLVPAFTAMPGWLARQGWFQAFMRVYFTVLRRVLLRSVATAVELVAKAGARSRWVRATDGMEAGGFALAAMTEQVLRTPPSSGVMFIDDLCVLESIVQRANQLAGRPVLELGSTGATVT